MNDTPRPSGLTALAIINFIIAACGALIALSRVAILSVDPEALTLPPEIHDSLVQMLAAGRGWLAFAGVSGLVLAVLLVLSGIGYLQQKRVMGRMLGNAYAVLSILARVSSVVMLSQGFGVGAAIMLCLGLVYPVVTLALVNTSFKANLVR
jgi:hypothetical protein